MASQNTTTNIQQQLADLERQELVADSTSIMVMQRYAFALADAFAAIDIDNIASNTLPQLAFLQSQLLTRIEDIRKIEKQQTSGPN